MNKKAAYNFNDLPGVAWIFLISAMFFVVAILVLTALGDNTNFAPLTTATDEEFTMPAFNGTITTSETYVISVSEIANSTGGVFPAVNYTVTNTGTDGGATIRFLENASVCKTGATCYATYTYYDHNGDTGTVLQNSISAMAEIPNNWLLLIAVVLAAAILIGIVINNLQFKTGR